MTPTLAEARAILGAEADGRSEEEIARVVQIAEWLADVAIERTEESVRRDERGAACA